MFQTILKPRKRLLKFLLLRNLILTQHHRRNGGNDKAAQASQGVRYLTNVPNYDLSFIMLLKSWQMRVVSVVSSTPHIISPAEKVVQVLKFSFVADLIQYNFPREVVAEVAERNTTLHR